MMHLADPLQNAALGVDVSASVDGLAAIHEAGRAATIWQREHAPSFLSWMDALAPSQLPRARVILRPEAVRDELASICEASGTPADDARDALIEDVAELAETFADLVKAPYLRLRCDVVTTNACRKFHVDAISARLICTYRGTGTQYGVAHDGEQPQSVFTVPTGSPIVLRGTLWPEHPKSGLLHRSPPIEGSGETRFVLVLDPIFDLENAV